MSWFDATGLANIAKNALKEAQKTIDKALDIRDDDNDDDAVNIKSKTDKNSGKGDVLSAGEVDGKHGLSTSTEDEKLSGNLGEGNKMPLSDWGSFSGSFFQIENSKISSSPVLISTQPQNFSLFPPNKEKKMVAPLTPETELSLADTNTITHGKTEVESLDQDPLQVSNSVKKNEHVLKKSSEQADEKECLLVIGSAPGKIEEVPSTEEKVITRPKGRRNSSNRNSYISNRLSVLSTDSEGKKSSDSVEVLESLSCTTSPDTDLRSVSASSSMGLPVSSSCTDSVEVIDSLASPSSIEVIVEGTDSGRTTQASSINSPKDEVTNPKIIKMFPSPISSVNDVSPESFEVIPDLPEYDEDLSVADSYTSASESTGATVLEPSYQYSYRMTESFTDLSQASSKFHSGDSTPDVITKLPSIHKNSSDVLSDSLPENSGFNILDSFHSKSTEIKKNSGDNEKINHKCLTPEETSENVLEMQNVTCGSSQGSPTRRPMLKPDDTKHQKLELIKSETVKTYSQKKDNEEGDASFHGSEKSESIGAEEICGSVSSYSDSRTVIANDSSCEEITLESSLEDFGNTNAAGSQVNTDYKTEEKLKHGGDHNHSFYVKNLLSEAIGEVSTTRETSPTLSEKSRSDLVKVGSEQTSGHTSGDELETTTSSDIEIISRYSPNGDSSSTTSRHSPAKLLHHNSKSKLSLVAVDILGKATQTKVKGHQREPSETSSFCSEENSSEVEKLSKRVSELTEILEARESRLNDLRKTNLEMQEKNQELKREVEQAKMEVTTGLHALQTDSEKDKLIKELKEEGEKLSKKELKQANLIKTLRAQEKSQQVVIDSNKIQIQTLTKTLEEVKQELSAKKESEKKLNENIKQMGKKITRQDEEIANLLDQMEKAVVKAEELKFLVESKEVELRKYKELLEAENFELQDAKSIAELKSKQLERLKVFQETAEIELENLRQQLKKSEDMYTTLEKLNREEKNEFIRKLQEAEGRNEELAQSVSKATKPLLRQMESLQAKATHEREAWEKQERNLQNKLEETESHLAAVMYREKSFKQETLELRTKVTNLEEQLQVSNLELATWKYQVSSLSKQLEETKKTLESEKANWERQQQILKSQINDLKEGIISLEHQLSTEKASLEAERKRTASLQDQLKERETHFVNRGDSNSPRSSPTLSFGRASLSESFSSNLWLQFGEDGFETASVSGRCSNVYENLKAGHTTSLIENLQAQLKMRDGEISQLQWELQRRDAERSALTAELSSLTSKLEEQESKLLHAEEADKNLKELQTNYDALLEMYGEKVEEIEELRLDLQDVKEMYKSQIDTLLKREKHDVSS